MNAGVRRRLFSGATRRAVEVRDRQCFGELCDVPAEHCEIDHIHWAEGGLTTEDNGRPACAYHNRGRHRRSYPPPLAGRRQSDSRAGHSPSAIRRRG
ncbi:MAG TPA: HNH endonuclease signature motif containing protein [Acidimicrobiia bacterium]|nr:HNH endonuclease signature motif containing protein [Acidimicrobiia bacterium]